MIFDNDFDGRIEHIVNKLSKLEEENEILKTEVNRLTRLTCSLDFSEELTEFLQPLLNYKMGETIGGLIQDYVFSNYLNDSFPSDIKVDAKLASLFNMKVGEVINKYDLVPKLRIHITSINKKE